VANLVFTFLIITTIINHADIPFFFYGTTMGAAVILLLLFLKEDATITIPKTPAVLVFIIFSIYLYHIPEYTFNLSRVALIGIFISITPILIFVIPKIIKKHEFLHITAVTATGFVIIGLPSMTVGDYSFFIFEITARGEHPYLSTYRTESISTTTVTSGYIAFMGLISGLAIRSTSLKTLVILICSIGVILPHSRASYIAVIASILTFVLVLYLKDEYVMPVMSILLVTGSIMFLSFIKLLPTPGMLETFRPAGRDEIFQAGVEAFLSRPVFGNGPANFSELVQQFTDRWSVGAGVYNQFLRMFISTGIVGGMSYLILIVSPILKFSVKNADTDGIIIYSLFIGIFVNELFTGRGIFGLSHSSVIAAISLGYIFHNAYQLDN